MNDLKLPKPARKKLLDILRHPQDGRLYRRALAVMDYANGKTITEIANELHVSRQSIYNWIERFQGSYDMEELSEISRSGRPSLWDEDAEAFVETLLTYSPTRFGFYSTCWTVALLQEQIHVCLGEYFSETTIRRGLHRLGYVWKRPRYILIPDPEREKKTQNSTRNKAIIRSLCTVGDG